MPALPRDIITTATSVPAKAARKMVRHMGLLLSKRNLLWIQVVIVSNLPVPSGGYDQ
jgi:hypothetical protein